MTGTLSYSEVIKDKQVAERAIGKILDEFQAVTKIQVTGVSITKLIGQKDTKIKASIQVNL